MISEQALNIHTSSDLTSRSYLEVLYLRPLLLTFKLLMVFRWVNFKVCNKVWQD